MRKIKTEKGYALYVGEDRAELRRGVFGKRVMIMSASGCDLIGVPDESGERKLIKASGEAPLSAVTSALIAVSRLWRDAETNEIFLLTDSGDTVLNTAAKKAEYIECRRVIRGAGEDDTVLYKRHTDR